MFSHDYTLNFPGGVPWTPVLETQAMNTVLRQLLNQLYAALDRMDDMICERGLRGHVDVVILVPWEPMPDQCVLHRGRLLRMEKLSGVPDIGEYLGQLPENLEDGAIKSEIRIEARPTEDTEK